jgi:uncharacterized protein (DUF2141 family)
MSTRIWISLALWVSLGAVQAVAQDTPPPAEKAPADAIVVEVQGLQSDQGQIGCAIFSKEEGFPDEIDKAMKQTLIKPKNKKVTCTFKGYAPGVYGISIMHDLDMNGELNTSFVGKPKEPWGVSKNAPAQRFGPPEWKDCKFKYEGGEKRLKIKLQK